MRLCLFFLFPFMTGIIIPYGTGIRNAFLFEMDGVKSIWIMRLRNIRGAREKIAESTYVVKDPGSRKGQWRALFASLREEAAGDQPLHVEIGTGKGRFLTTLAQQHPEILYLGIERFSSVLYRAVQKQEELQLKNLLFLQTDAELLETLFDTREVNRIYLNFSDPWPKERHAKRRLTSKEFLARYARVLTEDGTVEFKTDNRALFDFSLEEIPLAGFALKEMTYDLHGDAAMCAGNVLTEYEERFSAKGNPICKYVIQRKK